jgi:sigma-54-interacting transcriptional regulator
MANGLQEENRFGVSRQDDLGLVTLSGTALVNAPAEAALAIARLIGDELRGGCPGLFVVDCDRMTDSQMAFALNWYLADSSRGRVAGSLLLLREVQCLSWSNQTLLTHFVASRRRGADAVRIVASSSMNLYKRVCDQEFDASLFYLLNVVTLTPRRAARTHIRPAARRAETEGDSTGT